MKDSLLASNYNGSTPQNIPVINSLRGLAAVIVCLFHLVCLPLNFLENTDLYNYAPYGKYGVQIFFVITGIVIPISLINSKYNYSSFWKFIYKRIVRIEPPYIFSIIAGLVLLLLRNHIFSGKPHDVPSLKNLLLHIGYLIPFVKGEQWFIIVFWTMAVEFQFYLLISLIFPLLINRRLTVRLTCYILVFCLSLLLKSTIYAPVWMPVFMIGTIYISFLSGKIKLPEFIIILLASIIFSTILHSFIISSIAVFTLIIVHFFANFQNKLGNFLGSISYSLYLTHTIFGATTINIFVPFVSLIYLKILVVILGFAVSIITAYIFYRWIERPFQKYAAQIKLS